MDRKTKQQPHEPAPALPAPCENCAPNGGNWAHSIRHHEFGRRPHNYEMASRCSCARGQRLAAADRERAEGRTPVGMQVDHAEEDRRERQKWGQWKREHHQDQARARERIASPPIDFSGNAMPAPRLRDINEAAEFAKKVDA